VKFFISLLFLCAFLSAVTCVPADEPATAGESDAAAKDAASKSPANEEGRYRLLPIPIFITEPAIGEGLGLALALFHPVKQGKSDDTRLATVDSISNITEAREAPPVVTAVAGAYTNNETWAAGVAHANNWKNDSIRYGGVVGAAHINSKIYLANLPLKFSMDTRFVYQELKFRAGESDFMLGAGLSYMNADNIFSLGTLGLPEPIEVESSFKNVGIALKAAYDTRDNVMNPHSGQLLDFSAWRYDGAIGGSYDYGSVNLKALSFHGLTEKLTLGLRFEISAVGDDAPFFAVPFVKLRGIPALRYQNKVAGAGEVEMRYLLAARWEASIFGGVGGTSKGFPIYDNPGRVHNYGFGARYNVFRAHNVWVGLDVARGPDAWNTYIQVGHPW
jgi:hypothetical protein